jgi:cation diffusion facilitator CzcD-associated flavoprotein CzcO
VTPAYALGCKRIILSNDYYDALTRENVELVTEGIAEIRDRSILTRDHAERPFDAIIYATGFRATDLLSPLRVVGPNGADLREVWRDSAEAFLGMTVPRFPNFFMLVGPEYAFGAQFHHFHHRSAGPLHRERSAMVAK